MIGMSEYYIVLNKCEVGPSVEKLLSIFRQTGSVDLIGTDAYRIRNASRLDQQSTFEAFERAMDEDSPPNCDYCGNQPEECDCEPAEDNP
jgi:hypothetical protein